MTSYKTMLFIFIISILFIMLNSCASEQDYIKDIRENPDSIELREDYVDYLIKKEQYDKAIKECEMLEEKTSDIKYKYEIGILHLLRGRINNGLGIIQEVFDENPDFKFPVKDVYLGKIRGIGVQVPEHWLVKKVNVKRSLHKNKVEIISIDGIDIEYVEYIDMEYIIFDIHKSAIQTHESIKNSSRTEKITPIYLFSTKGMEEYDPEFFTREYEVNELNNPCLGFYTFTLKKDNKKYLRAACTSISSHGMVDKRFLYHFRFSCDEDSFNKNAVYFYKVFKRFFNTKAALIARRKR